MLSTTYTPSIPSGAGVPQYSVPQYFPGKDTVQIVLPRVILLPGSPTKFEMLVPLLRLPPRAV